MKVAYVTTYDLQNRASWPKYHQGLYGASCKIAQTLEAASLEVRYLGPLMKPKSPITRLKWLFYRHIQKRDFYSWADPIVLNHYARQIEAKLSPVDVDLVLCPENAVLISRLKVDRPLVLWTDTPVGSLVDFYPYLCNLCGETRRNLYRMEKSALERCDLIIFTSDWAAQKATQLYGIRPEKIRVLPRGSNQERTLSIDQVEDTIQAKSPARCNLLFVGVDWHRKGGAIALAVAQALNQRGLPTKLHLVGSEPPKGEPLPPFVKSYGFLDRTQPEGRATLEALMCQAHFLILPTQAEHCAIVLSEANAYGVPCLTTNIGGIPSVIKEGGNGKTFALDADVSEYCDYVLDIMGDRDRYQALALSSLQEFETRLSWDVTQSKLHHLLSEVITA